MTIKCTLDESDIIKLIAKCYGVDEDDVIVHPIKVDTPHGLVDSVVATFTKECSNNDIMKL